MTRPTARVLALLEILQSGGTRTVAELAARLEVDERTVRRYVAHLTDLGIPVQSLRGRYGGYRLAPGHRMPPLMLTDEEALAVLVGLIAGRRAGWVTASAAAAQSAVAKLQRVLPEALGRRLGAVTQTTEFTGRPRSHVAPQTGVLLLLAEAVRDRSPVAITYTAGNGRRTQRTVQPSGIVAHSGRWYVTAADSRSGETRTFRMDRIVDPQLLAGRFEVPAGFDPAERVRSSIALAPRRHTVTLRVRAAADEVQSRFPAGIAEVHAFPADNQWVRVVIHAEHLDWVPGVLAAVALPFVIDGPEELRELVRALAERLAASTDRSSDPADTGAGAPASGVPIQ